MIRSTIILFLCFLQHELLYSQNQYWENLDGPTGGVIYSIGVDSNTIYCAGNGGVFVSDNYGEKWKCLGLRDETVHKVSIVSGHIIAITNTGCFRAALDDTAWTKVKQGQWQSLFAKDSIIFIGSAYSGIFRSFNLGGTWVEVNKGIDNTDIEELFITSNNIILAGAAGTSGSGVFRSTNFGDNWERINPYHSAWHFDGITELNNVLYGFDFNNSAKVYKSTDFGQTWFLPAAATAPSDIIQSIYSDNSGIYVGVYHYGIYQSKDEGVNWRNLNIGLTNKDVFSLNANSSHIFAATFDGFYKTSKAKFVWEKKNEGLNNTWITSLSVADNELIVGTYGSGLFINEGNGFSRVNLGSEMMFIIDNAVANNKIYVLATSWSPTLEAKFLVSSDKGKSWVGMNDGFDTGELKCIAANNNFIYVGSGYGLFRMPKNGSTWEKLTNGIPNNGYISGIATSDSVIIATNGSSQIYRSSDYGSTWQNIYVQNIYAGEKIVSSKKGEFYLGSKQVNRLVKSTDYGLTWHSINLPFLISSVQALLIHDSEVFVGLSNNGILSSVDNGKNWKINYIGLDAKSITSFSNMGNTIYAGTKFNGIYKRIVDMTEPIAGNSFYNQTQITFKWTSTVGIAEYRFQLAEDSLFSNLLIDKRNIFDTTYTATSLDYNKVYFWRVSSITKYWDNHFFPVKRVEVGRPLNYLLTQNYPNPFNPNTTIAYALPYRSNVNITVYNSVGEIVKVFSEGVKEADFYTLKFSGEGFSSGVYLYSINAVSLDGKQSFRETKKMILLK
jgi:photosystem II stability/assembly factor-like uncharacterized protein